MAISNDKMSDSIRSESIDFSIIKTDPARATFEQAKTFAAIFESEENRLECFRWLLANDPTIHTLYGHALKHGAAADPLFILLALVNLLSIKGDWRVAATQPSAAELCEGERLDCQHLRARATDRQCPSCGKERPTIDRPQL